MSTGQRHEMDGEVFTADGLLIFKLCIDSMDGAGDMSGRIYCGYAKQYIAFRRLNDGLRVLRKVLELSRSGARCEDVFTKSNGLRPFPKDIEYWNTHMLFRKRGEFGNVYLHFRYDESGNLWESLVTVIFQNRGVYDATLHKRSELKNELLKIGAVFAENQKPKDIRAAFLKIMKEKHSMQKYTSQQ